MMGFLIFILLSKYRDGGSGKNSNGNLFLSAIMETPVCVDDLNLASVQSSCTGHPRTMTPKNAYADASVTPPASHTHASIIHLSV